MDAGDARSSVVRPELGPTLPALMRRRFGDRGRTILVVAVGALVVLLVSAAVLHRVRQKESVFTHRSPGPAFTLKLNQDRVKHAAPGPGELERFTMQRRKARASVTIRPLELEPFKGDASHAILPSFADRYVDQLARTRPDLRVADEGKARVNGAPGYQIGYRWGPPGDRVLARDVLLLPDEEGSDGGVVVRFEISRKGGRVRPGDRRRLNDVKRAFRSFRFGTDRP